MKKTNLNETKSKVLSKFYDHCAYCGKGLSDSIDARIDHFIPKSLHPNNAGDINNLVLSCQECNRRKSDRFPVDSEGNGILINPITEFYSDHMTLGLDGKLKPKGRRGSETIDLLDLNSPPLIAQRHKEMLPLDIASMVSAFREQFPISKLSKLKLDEYTSTDTQNYFTYWLEHKTALSQHAPTSPILALTP